MILKYMTLGVVVLYVLFIVYFKLRYPFWSRQPVFYYHDIKNMIYPKGIIQLSLPNVSYKLNNSIDFKDVKLMTSQEMTNLTNFIKNNYMTEPHEKYTPTKDDIKDQLICRNMPSSVSMYYDNLYGDLIGTMTSAFKIFIKPNVDLQVAYIDNLCVDKKHRGKNIAGQIIENHYIRERYQNKVSVFMFKHEGISRPFVPLTIYHTYFYKLNQFHKIIITQNYLKCVLVTKDLSYLLYDLQTSLKHINNNKHQHNNKQQYNNKHQNKLPFQCVVMDDLEHLMYLIKKQHIHVFCLLEEKTPLAFYFFKDIYTTYNGEKSIECFSCIKFKPNLENDKFVLGFYLAIDYIKSIDKYKILLLENISDTHYLLQTIKQSPYHSSKYYYYMFNYAMRPVSSKQIVIL